MQSFASYPSLKDRSVFISGGGSGIGASIVEHFAAQGSKVAFVDVDESASKALAGKTGALFVKCDIRDVKAYQAAIGDVAAKHGPITALVNNAARDDRHELEDVTPEFWDERIAVNLRHAYFAVQAVAPGMKKAGGGAIVNFSSVSYHTMTPSLSVYQAAKAAVMKRQMDPSEYLLSCKRDYNWTSLTGWGFPVHTTNARSTYSSIRMG